MSSGGSNLAADSPDLLALVEQRRAQIAADNGVDPAQVPPDALTASGSGLDPEISPAYALLQVNRVADARGLTPDQVRDLVDSHIQGRALGFIGEERVNVLELNLALRAAQPRRSGMKTVAADEPAPPPAVKGKARGRLRVYLGAAPGVGKTVDMLCEGRRRAGRGTDVVIGIVRDPRPGVHRASSSAICR